MAAGEVFWTFLKLGCTAFGGPSAHLGYFRTAFVQRRRWLSDARYAELVALGQFLPGPASSQVGFAIGLERAGAAGGAAAWAGFTLPSALIMLAAAFGLAAVPAGLLPGVVQGLKLVAVAVVLHAVLGMAETLCRDRLHRLLGVGALVLALLVEGVAGQLAALVLAGLAAFFVATTSAAPAAPAASEPATPKRVGAGPFVLVGVAIGLLLALPFARALPLIAIAEPFYRAGGLVFGGGHVVLPFLETATVGPGGLPAETFLAGYGIAQAIPGPLFTFAAYLGAASHGLTGGAIALVAIFAPGLLLMAGALPLWARLSHKPGLRRALGGVNAAVVGLLAAALYDPLWTTAVRGPLDVAAVAVGWAMLQVLRWPPWSVALAGLAYGLALALATP